MGGELQPGYLSVVARINSWEPCAPVRLNSRSPTVAYICRLSLLYMSSGPLRSPWPGHSLQAVFERIRSLSSKTPFPTSSDSGLPAAPGQGNYLPEDFCPNPRVGSGGGIPRKVRESPRRKNLIFPKNATGTLALWILQVCVSLFALGSGAQPWCGPLQQAPQPLPPTCPQSGR